MAKTLQIKQHSLQPYYPFAVVDSDGKGVDLFGATIKVSLWPKDSGSPLLDMVTAGVVVTDPETGLFEYRWQPGDTETVGIFEIEAEVIPLEGGKFDVPFGTEKALVLIVADRDDE